MTRAHAFAALATFAAIAAPDLARGQDAGPPEIAIREALALERPVGGPGGARRGGRVAVQVDPVAAAIVAGRFNPPKAGGRLTDRDGAPAWTSVTADAEGRLGGGRGPASHTYANVPSQTARVMILEATGCSSVDVNGEPRPGDVYNYGSVKLPVALKAGDNGLLFRAGRGPLKARLVAPRGPAQIETADATLPDLVAGRDGVGWGAVVVLNATEAPLTGLVLRAEATNGPAVDTPLPPIAPLMARKVGFRIQAPPIGDPAGATRNVTLTVRPAEGDRPAIETAKVGLRVREPGQARKVTFVSKIDGSVQYYGLVPAAPGRPGDPAPGLILSLHGASVEGIGQAEVYAPRPWAHVVTPTNRRPYGFDWEDWGRLDALEVLGLASKALEHDPRKVWLTGHSMGGHGTWHLGVTFPDRWAAIAPSAGWVSMMSYAGAAAIEDASPVARALRLSATASDTLALAPNLARPGLGVYVLHGSADDNVPVGQARTMRQTLGGFHPDFTYFEQPGAGHWWGNECCDWPPLMDFLRRHTLPAPADVKAVDFVTAGPGVSSRCHWAEVWSQLTSPGPSELHLTYDPERRRFRGTTKNVGRLALDLGHVPPGAVTVSLDGVEVEIGERPGGTDARLWLRRSGDAWTRTDHPPAAEKGPARAGGFKDALNNRVVFVYGTKGAEAENRQNLARARFDAERFWYQGNGSVDVVADTAFDPSAEPDRNVIVYGHAGSHEDWAALLGSSPVQVKAGSVTVGDREVKGDALACLFVRPRPGSDLATVGVVSGTGPAGLVVAGRLPFLTSGVAYPDLIIVGPESLESGVPGVIAAGGFAPDWGVAGGSIAWRD